MQSISGPLNPISDNSKHIYLILQTYVGQGNLTELDLMEICVREKLQRLKKNTFKGKKSPPAPFVTYVAPLSHPLRSDQC